MHYSIQELAELKKAIKPTQQAQIPMPAIPKKRGGAGRGQGRKPTNGEKKQSKVIRVPLDKLDLINEVLALDVGYCRSIHSAMVSWMAHNPDVKCKHIMSIKPKETKPAEPIIDGSQPIPIPAANIKPHHRKAQMKYAMTVNGIDHYWSGKGRMPKAFNDYVYDHNNGVMISYNEREEFFKRFLIEENEQ